MAAQKNLTILRHAKTETGSASQEDHDRALTARGINASHIMGEYLSRKAQKFDLVICSTAVRARQTWQEMQQTFPIKVLTTFEKKMYLASGNEILNLLANVPEEVNSLLIIGHNPGLHQLALKLAKSGDEVLLEILAQKFPTCALASFVFDPPWRNVAQTKGRLLGFMTPKMLSGEGDD